MSRSLGIPVKLLHEAAGHIVTVELKTGELYRGSLLECEDNWNCQLENITFTSKDGKVSQLEHVFIRGSRVRFMIIPDMLKNAPMFKRLEARIRGKGSALGVGRGRAVAMRARAQAVGHVYLQYRRSYRSITKARVYLQYRHYKEQTGVELNSLVGLLWQNLDFLYSGVYPALLPSTL
ncbi:small nuclear ribonucleoprotein SmD3b-like [Carex rostrata]